MTTRDALINQPMTYTDRIIRRILPVLGAVIALFALFSIYSVVNVSTGVLQDEHASVLRQATTSLENTIREMAGEAQIIAGNENMITFIADDTTSLTFQDANLLSVNALRLNPNYRAIRVLTPDGNVLLEALQENQIITETAPTVLAQAADAIYNGTLSILDDVAGLPSGESYMSAFRPDAEQPNVLVADVLAPIYNAFGDLIGIVQIEVNTTTVLNTINLAEGVLLETNTNRRLVLLTGEQVAADSGSIGNQHLETFQSGIEPASMYTALATYARDATEGAITELVGSQILSVETLAPNNVAGLDWQVVVVDEFFIVYRAALIGTVVIALIVLLLIVGGTAFIRQRLVAILSPVDEAESFTLRLADASMGSINETIPSSDSPSVLMQSVEKVSQRINRLETDLHTQIERRNRDMQVAGRIGRDSAQQSDLNALMRQALNVICVELDFYHAQVFLIDSVETFAQLAYSRGEAGKKLLERGHKLRVGSASIIGTCTSEKRPVVVNDTQRDSENELHGFNPFLPNTRAEMGLPLYIGDEVIGALDIQSLEPNVFLTEDIPTYQLIADQLAVAIYNARLREQADNRYDEINRLNRQLTSQAWQTTDDDDLYPMYGASDVEGQIEIPIALRGEVLGTVQADLPEDLNFSEGDRIILESLANRVALAVENARLFEQTQSSLSETSTLYNLSSRLNEADDLEDVLAAVIDLTASTASGGQVWLFGDYMPGDTPEWVHITVDYSVEPRDYGTDLVGTQLQFGGHNFFDRLTPDAALLLPDVRSERMGSRLSDLFRRLQARAVIFVPLTLRSTWKGFLTFEFPTPRAFTAQEQRIYDALIGQAGVAIDNRLLLQQTESALARQERLYASSRIINTAQGLSDLIYSAIATASDPALDFWISLLDPSAREAVWPNRARLAAYSEGGETFTDNLPLALSISDNSPMKRREPQIIHIDQPEETGMLDYIAQMRERGYQCMTIFPLFSDNVPIALFHIVSPDDYELSADDYEVYKALTGMMSTQIQKTRLLARTEDALEETRRLYVATRAIASAAEVLDIYQAVYQHIAEPFFMSEAHQDDYITMSVLLARPEPDLNAPELVYDYFHSNYVDQEYDTRIGKVVYQTDVQLGELIETSDDGTIVYHDVLQTFAGQVGIGHVLAPMQETSVVIAPLWSRRQWFGVMMVHTTASDLLDESYTRFVQAVADQVAIAIENQRLLFETENERRRLNTILSTLPSGVLVLDPMTLYPQQHNERAEELLQQTIDYNAPFEANTYHIHRTGTELAYPEDEMPVRVAQREQRRVLGDDVAIIRDGYPKVDLLVSAAPIFDNNYRPTAIIVAFEDISTLRSMESTMQENLRETVLLYETQRSLTDAESLNDLLDNIIGQLAMQQASDAHIVIYDADDRSIRLVRSMVEPLIDVQVLRPIFTKDIVTINDIQNDPIVNDLMRQVFFRANARSIMTIPLRSNVRNAELGWMILVDADPNAFTVDQERVLSTVGDMASGSLDNSYLVQSTQTALNETANLYSATTAISRSKDLPELYTALEEALKTLEPDMWAGFLYQDKSEAVEMFKQGFEPSEGNGLDFQKLLSMPLHQQEGVYVADVSRTTLGEFEMEMLQGGNIKAFSAVNLRVKDTPGGRLFIGYREAHRFTQGETRFMNAVADSASVVIDNQLLLEQVQSTLQETSVLYQASKALLDSTTPKEIIDVVVNFLIEPHINQVFIALLNQPSWDHPNAAVEVAATWQFETDVDLMGVMLSADQFPAWRQLAVPTVLVISDLYNPDLDMDPIEQTSIISLDVRSLVVIPLRVPSRSIGAIWLGSQEEHVYTDRDLRMFQSFGEQTSLTLEANRLLDQTENRARQLETIAAIGQSVGQILDLGVLLPQVVDLVKDQFLYDQVQVFLMDDEHEWALLQASTGEAGQQLLAISHKLRKGSRSVIGQVSELGQPTIALDTADADVIHQPNPYLPLTRSEMAIPLIVKGEVVGALDVQSNQPKAFDDEDLQVLQALANQISVAIDNARLYEQAQKSARDTNFLFEISREAAAAYDLESSMQSVVNMVYNNSQIQAASVVVYLPEYYADYYGNSKTFLEVAALRCDFELLQEEMPTVEVGDPNSIIGRTSETHRHQIIHDVRKEPLYKPTTSDAVSAVIMPLSAGTDLVGTIVLESRRPNAYTEEAISLLQTLASSLSSIVQNRLLLVQLQESNDQLREVDKLKSQFLASMSHELRTPLNSIIGFSRVMLKGIDGPLTEMQEQDLNTIYTSGNHLLNLINDVLDQAKIEANKLNLKFAYFEIKPMIESVKSIAIGLLNEKPELRLYVDIAQTLPLAFGDEFRTRQILLNIVTNAIKFTQDGTVTVRAYGIETRQGQMVRIDVEDTGIGIAQEDMPVLFESFRQVDSSLTRTVGGTGLGLPISKSLAELQGGELLVASEVNVGSVFSVTIPTYEGADKVQEDRNREQDMQNGVITPPMNGNGVRDTAETAQATDEEFDPTKTNVLNNIIANLNLNKVDEDTKPTRPKGKSLEEQKRQTHSTPIPGMNQKRDVILVEDNKDMVDQFRRLLQREGFQVTTADFAAFAEAMIGQIRPSLVILDVNFAEGEGWTILGNLKERDDTFDIPIVVTTLDGDSERAYRLGAHTFIQRPFDPDKLLESVLEAEKESKRERILIIDDQPDAIRLLEQLLGEHGDFRIFSAQSGDEGISLVARRRPDLIILDLRMPDKDGFAVLDELRDNPETANIPVLIVTGDINLTADELAQLENIRVLPKADISQAEYDLFIDNVRSYLEANNGK